MKILCIAAEFPPLNTTGNYRISGFVKKLPEYGVQPVVITFTEEEGLKIFNCKKDDSLLRDMPPEVVIRRIPLASGALEKLKRRNFAEVFFSLNDRIDDAWGLEIEKKLPEIIKEHKPEALFVSFPPFSLWRTAIHVSKKYKLPLITDMRDLWSAWGSSPNPSYLHYLMKKRQEHTLFSNSHTVLCVTPQLRDIFLTTHPDLPATRFNVLSNGFDLPDKVSSFSKPPVTSGTFKIGYIGSFYYSPDHNTTMLTPWFKRPLSKILWYNPTKEDWLYRTPYFFLKTLEELFKKYPFYREKLEFHFAGNEPAWLLKMIDDTGLKNNYRAHGFLNTEQLQRFQNGVDAFLATSEKVLDGEHYCLPSKLFQYLKHQKPVLGFVTPGAQKDFLTGTGTSILFNPDNIPASAEELHYFLQSGADFKVNHTYLNEFSVNTLTKQLTNIIFTATSQAASL